MPKIVGGSLAEHRDRVREQLFAALRTLLSRQGYDSITLADIAAAAGLGRTAMYNHFPDKESLLLALVQYETDEYLDQLRAALSTVDNPIDRFALFVRMQLAELAGSHTRLAGVGAVLSDRGRARIGDHVAPMLQILGDILRDAMSQRYIPEQDIDVLVPLISAATASRVTTGLSGPQLDAVIDTAVHFVARGIGVRYGPGERPRRLPSGRG